MHKEIFAQFCLRLTSREPFQFVFLSPLLLSVSPHVTLWLTLMLLSETLSLLLLNIWSLNVSLSQRKGCFLSCSSCHIDVLIVALKSTASISCMCLCHGTLTVPPLFSSADDVWSRWHVSVITLTLFRACAFIASCSPLLLFMSLKSFRMFLK